jgi:hypothetical protein
VNFIELSLTGLVETEMVFCQTGKSFCGLIDVAVGVTVAPKLTTARFAAEIVWRPELIGKLTEESSVPLLVTETS